VNQTLCHYDLDGARTGYRRHGGSAASRVAQALTAVLPLVVVAGPVAAGPQAVAAVQRDAPGRPSLAAVRIPDGQSIRLDGALDEALWSSAEVATDFVQREPANGSPATERSEVRVLYDSGRLLIGARLHDSEPRGILGNQMQRDQSLSSDDRFIVTLDTFRDGRTGYLFETNPLGALADGLVATSSNSNDQSQRDVGGAVNRSWDGIWDVRARRDARGWSVEIEVPFRTLNFDPGLDTWGINFGRTVRRKAEESVWTGHLRNEGVAHMASAGLLEGLHGISQGLGLDVKPYAVGNLSSAPGFGQQRRIARGTAGLDLFYNVTAALRADLSINTDFAETAVDDRQVNLTRFPLFFQERRDFFLQGATYFDFAREIGNQVTPFFSRRIGLHARGVPQPIDVGAKLTGQAGAFDLGVLHVRTRESGGQPGTDFTVARLRRRLLAESYVGLLYTRRAERIDDAGDRHTLGVDAVLRTSSFGGRRTLEWSNWFLHTTSLLDAGRNIGRGSRLAFPNDPFYFDFSYRELQANYDPAVGFIQRRGSRRFNPEVGYTFRFGNHRWLRSLQHELDWDWYTDARDGRRLSETYQIKPVTVVFSDGSEFAYELHPTYERLVEDFEISDGIILPAGRAYRFTRHEITGAMADRYPWALGGQVRLGRFLSGTSAEYEGNVRLRPRPGISLRLEAEYASVVLAQGRFATRVFRTFANTQFSPWLSLENTVQYDSVTSSLGWQTRFRWIPRPGNDLFVVYTHNWHDTLVDGPDGLLGRRPGFRTLDTRAAAKLAYTVRF
jgi:hypothetical protein